MYACARACVAHPPPRAIPDPLPPWRASKHLREGGELPEHAFRAPRRSRPPGTEDGSSVQLSRAGAGRRGHAAREADAACSGKPVPEADVPAPLHSTREHEDVYTVQCSLGEVRQREQACVIPAESRLSVLPPGRPLAPARPGSRRWSCPMGPTPRHPTLPASGPAPFGASCE